MSEKKTCTTCAAVIALPKFIAPPGATAKHGPCPACTRDAHPRARLCPVCRALKSGWSEHSDLEVQAPQGDVEAADAPAPKVGGVHRDREPRHGLYDPGRRDVATLEREVLLVLIHERETGRQRSDAEVARLAGCSRQRARQVRDRWQPCRRMAEAFEAEVAQAIAVSARRRTRRQRALVASARTR